jgi:hypothetical protein
LITKDDDTDPSTPTARRSSNPAVHEGTDPGVGDPVTEPVAIPNRPLGIVVPGPGLSTMTPTPPPSAAQQAILKNKDSVEILLEGMTDQRLERTRTTPQSDGQASAAYHAAHAPHAPGPVPPNDDGPKVVLDRPLTPTAVSPRQSPAPVRAQAVESTVVPPGRLGRRVAVAAAAGLLVAAAVFLVLEMALRQGAGAGTSATTSMAAGTSATTSTAAGAEAPTAAAGVAGGMASAPAGAETASAPMPSSARGHAGTKRHTKGASGASGDIGEFRTNF